MAFTGSLFVIMLVCAVRKIQHTEEKHPPAHYCCQINLDKSQRPPYKPHRFLDGVITVLLKIFIDEAMRNMLRPLILFPEEHMS